MVKGTIPHVFQTFEAAQDLTAMNRVGFHDFKFLICQPAGFPKNIIRHADLPAIMK